MRSLFLFILLTSFSITSLASEFLDGYVILPNNDTVKCKFKADGRKKAISFKRITILTENGAEQVYNAEDKKILGFGLVENGRPYDFLFVDVKPKSESGFYQRIVDGNKYKLYVHQMFIQGYPGVNTAAPQYVVYNPAGEYVSFETCILCPWKKRLRQLLKDDPKALALLENASRLEIPNFITEINQD